MAYDPIFQECTPVQVNQPIKDGLVLFRDSTDGFFKAKRWDGSILIIGGGGGVGVQLHLVTYAQLFALVGGSSLVQGDFYLITDFQTIHVIPNTIDVNTGAVEPIILYATDVNKLGQNANSTIFPQDEISYELVDTTTSGATKGRIYYRKDTLKNNSTHYDWRVALFRRWETAPASGQFTILTDNGNAFNDYFTFNNSASAVGCSNNSIGGLYPITPFPIPTNGLNNLVFQCRLQNNEFDFNCFNSTIGGVVVFGLPPCTDNKVAQIFYNNTIGFPVAPFTATMMRNKIGYGFTDNTIKQMAENDIGRAFSGNAIEKRFSFNVTQAQFTNNTIGDRFEFNNISDQFDANIIGTDFLNNSIGDSFTANTITNFFTDNVIGNNFTANGILDNFQFNQVGYNFNSNPTIGVNFQNNIIGNDCLTNTIDSSFTFNVIGALFQGNTIGIGFTENRIADQFDANTIASGFQQNSIGSAFVSNGIGTNCSFNQIENNCNTNTIGLTFSSNKIGNFCSGNFIADTFQQNVIGNFMASNIIGNRFLYNNIGESFGSNTIEDDFQDNYLKNGFAINDITSFFKRNSIGLRFGNNIIADNFQNNLICNDLTPIGTNFNLATLVYTTYQKEIFENSVGVFRLKYTDGADTIIYATPTT